MKRRRTGSTAALAANRCCRCAASASASIPNVSKNPTCDEATKTKQQTNTPRLDPDPAQAAADRSAAQRTDTRFIVRGARRVLAVQPGAAARRRRRSAIAPIQLLERKGRAGTGRDGNTTVTLCPRRVCVRISTAGGAAPPAARRASSRAMAQRAWAPNRARRRAPLAVLWHRDW
jgi:hypothetical protein